MSIVGPRPLDSKEAKSVGKYLDGYMMRYYIRPGITGLAQINGYRGGTSDMNVMKKRIELDNYYINNWTLYLDIKIVLKTIVKLIMGDEKAY